MAVSRDCAMLAFGIYDDQERRDYLKIAPFGSEVLKTVFRTEPGEFIMNASTMAWSHDGNAVLVTRCKSGSPQKCEVWRTPIDGSAPELVAASNTIQEIRVSPGGRSLAYYAQQYMGEIWVMENFLH
jgi:hypothetical protein